MTVYWQLFRKTWTYAWNVPLIWVFVLLIYLPYIVYKALADSTTLMFLWFLLPAFLFFSFGQIAVTLAVVQAEKGSSASFAGLLHSSQPFFLNVVSLIIVTGLGLFFISLLFSPLLRNIRTNLLADLSRMEYSGIITAFTAELPWYLFRIFLSFAVCAIVIHSAGFLKSIRHSLFLMVNHFASIFVVLGVIWILNFGFNLLLRAASAPVPSSAGLLTFLVGLGDFFFGMILSITAILLYLKLTEEISTGIPLI